MIKKTSNNETSWVELGLLPAAVGYVPNEEAWHATLKLLGADSLPYPVTDGNCSVWDDVGPDHKTTLLITIGERAKEYSLSQVCGIIVHECMHAWRHIRESIGEKKPSAEFEAYMMQGMSQCIIYAHQCKRRKPWKKS